MAILRAKAGRDPHDKRLTDLIGELSTLSEPFQIRWAAHNVKLHRTGVKRIHHPIVGDLTLAYEGFELPGDPGQMILVYSAEPATPPAEALSLLGSWAAAPPTQPERPPDHPEPRRRSAIAREGAPTGTPEHPAHRLGAPTHIAAWITRAATKERQHEQGHRRRHRSRRHRSSHRPTPGDRKAHPPGRSERTDVASCGGGTEAGGHEVTTRQVDVSSRDSVHALAMAAAELGPVVNVVHTAGLSPVQAPVQAVLEVDLGVAVVLEEFGRGIAPGGAGLVISSMAGHMLPALAPEQDAALAQTPTDELLDLPMLSPEAVSNSPQASFEPCRPKPTGAAEQGKRVVGGPLDVGSCRTVANGP